MFKQICLLILTHLCVYSIVAQSYTMTNGGNTTSCSGVFFDPGGSGNYTGETSDWTYTICNPTPGQPIYIDFNTFDLWSNNCPSGSSLDELFVYNGSTVSSTPIGVFSDVTGPPNVITGTTGCLTFKFHRENLGGSGCPSNSGDIGWIASVSCNAPPNGASCPNAYPFCTTIAYNFQNSTGTTAPVGPDYGCLVSQPAPVWYYMKVDQSGSFQIGLGQTTGSNGSGSGIDVDFALYGPFSSLAAGCSSVMNGVSQPIQCSFSSASTEVIGIGLSGGTGSGSSTPPPALVDQYYILLLTNYSNATGYISFNQTGGTGVADCSIVIPCDISSITATPGPCLVASNTYSLAGQINFTQAPTSGTLSVTSSCGGSQVFSAPFTSPLNYNLTGIPSNGSSCTVTALFSENPSCSKAQTYIAPPSCFPPCTVTASASSLSICSGNSLDLSATDVVDAAFSWVGPSGYQSGIQNPINVTPPAEVGEYTYTVTATSALTTCTAVITIAVTPGQSVNANNDQTVCEGESIQLSGMFGGVATSAQWSAPSGTFSNVNSLSSMYTPSPSETSVQLTLTTSVVGDCPAKNDVMLVTINPPPNVDAGENVVVCLNQTVTLYGAGASTYDWNNGILNGESFIPSASGFYTVVGTDLNGCKAIDSVFILVKPYPAPVINYSADSLYGCTPHVVTFTNLSTNTVSCLWDFGDGTTSNSCGPISHIYNEQGCFDVVFTGTSDQECVTSLTSPGFICTEDAPIASFHALPNPITILGGQVLFENTTLGGLYYSWDFGNYNTSNEVTPFNFYYNPEIGNIPITLIAETQFGCRDTARYNLVVVDELIYYIPNTFTPDDNEFNSTFNPVFTSGYDPNEYEMLIFNRWGEQVFETHDMNYGWSGYYGVGALKNKCQTDTYTYKITFTSIIDGERRVITGHVNLL